MQKTLDPQRIVIHGGSGSGKTYLANELGKILNLQVTSLDNIYHGPNWKYLPNEKLRRQVNQITKENSWIIDGNYTKLADIIIPRATMVIIIRIPLIHQLKQLILSTIGRGIRLNLGPITPLPINVVSSGTKENTAEALYVLTKSAFQFYNSKYHFLRDQLEKLVGIKKVIVLRSVAQRDNFVKRLLNHDINE